MKLASVNVDLDEVPNYFAIHGLDPAGRASMLRLIEDLLAETGKSVLFCTHLLGDVERVCRQVVVMHRGTVAVAGSLHDLRQASRRRYAVSWQGDGTTFVATLRDASIELLPNNAISELGKYNTAILALPDDTTTAQLFALARTAGVTLVELRPEHEDLEQLFVRVTQPAEAARVG